MTHRFDYCTGFGCHALRVFSSVQSTKTMLYTLPSSRMRRPESVSNTRIHYKSSVQQVAWLPFHGGRYSIGTPMIEFMCALVMARHCTIYLCYDSLRWQRVCLGQRMRLRTRQDLNNGNVQERVIDKDNINTRSILNTFSYVVVKLRP